MLRMSDDITSDVITPGRAVIITIEDQETNETRVKHISQETFRQVLEGDIDVTDLLLED